MKMAIEEAKKSLKTNDVPVGAVIVRDGIVISKAHNEKERKQIAVNHAEIIAIKKACKKLKTWRLDNCVIYVTLEPCMMCTGAIKESRISGIIYATESEKYGYANKQSNKKNFFVKKGYLEKESKKILRDFFIEKR